MDEVKETLDRMCEFLDVEIKDQEVERFIQLCKSNCITYHQAYLITLSAQRILDDMAQEKLI